MRAKQGFPPASYADSLWAHHAIFFPHQDCVMIQKSVSKERLETIFPVT